MNQSRQELADFRRCSDTRRAPIARCASEALSGGNSIHTIDVVYDALDYRLMETFPASDATAQF